MGKREIARYEQFLLFPQYFQKACFLEASKGIIVREWVNTQQSSIKEKVMASIEPFILFKNAILWVLIRIFFRPDDSNEYTQHKFWYTISNILYFEIFSFLYLVHYTMYQSLHLVHYTMNQSLQLKLKVLTVPSDPLQLFSRDNRNEYPQHKIWYLIRDGNG